MVGPGHYPMIHDFMIWPITFLGSGPILLSFEKNLNLIKIFILQQSMNSTKQKVHVGSQYTKTCLKQPLKKDETKILITNGSLMQVERIGAFCYTFDLHLAIIGLLYFSGFMLGPIMSENDPPFFAPWVTSAHQS